MIVKPRLTLIKKGGKFESDVISDDSQTSSTACAIALSFESDVISDDSQTIKPFFSLAIAFESDVISDDSQSYCTI